MLRITSILHNCEYFFPILLSLLLKYKFSLLSTSFFFFHESLGHWSNFIKLYNSTYKKKFMTRFKFSTITTHIKPILTSQLWKKYSEVSHNSPTIEVEISEILNLFAPNYQSLICWASICDVCISFYVSFLSESLVSPFVSLKTLIIWT